MVNWNNAPEWADRHGIVGTNRDSIWFNDTKYAYCQMPDNIFMFSIDDNHPFQWSMSEVQDVTNRPLSKFTASQIKEAPPKPESVIRYQVSGGEWSHEELKRVGWSDEQLEQLPKVLRENKQVDKVIGLVSDADVSFYESRGYITVVAGEKLTEAMTQDSPHIYYIAGPMSGLPNFNRDAFNAAATKLTASGHTVLNPATLPDGLSQAQYIDICLAMLRCATHVQMLRGWDDSRGAFAERALALKLGLTVEYV